MPYCENCGSQVSTNAKFCGNCGTARTQSTPSKPANPQPAQPRQRLNYYSPPPANAYVPPPTIPIMQAQMAQTQPVAQPIPAPIQQSSEEATVGVILLRKLKSMGRWDTFTGVMTTQRLILAQMTSQMLADASQQSREQAKAEGKGFFGQWADQLRATSGYTQRYLTMPPQAVLAETQGNFALYNNTISKINVRLKGANHEHNQRREFEVEFYSSAGVYVFRMDENSEFTDMLKRVYGSRVEMPFGYFSKSVNIKI